MSHRDNFVIYTDSEGKLPQLRRIGVPLGCPLSLPDHNYWTEYRNNKPVKIRPYPGQTREWCYDRCEYISIDRIPQVD